MTEPALPYENLDGSASVGWSGTDTPARRAKRETKKAGENQRVTVELLERAQYRGLTFSDLMEATGRHHGTASGVLSNLHAGNRIHRLSVEREGRKVYVLPEFVGGRRTEAYGRRDTPEGVIRCPHCGGKFVYQQKGNTDG